MKDQIIFVKLNSSAQRVQSAINFVRESFRNQEERFYYTSDTDTETIIDMFDSLAKGDLSDYRIVFIEYRKTPEIYIKKLYAGKTVRLEKKGESCQIFYRITEEIDSPLVIDNFMIFSNLSIERDFEEDSHISIEESAPLLLQLSYATDCPRNGLHMEKRYCAKDSEKHLSPFAQRNENCVRLYNILPPSENRGEFQRDYDRILHCKSFRRMVDKAQIFTASKGDHYRTRMTHTLCVAQIARSIALRLDMNVPLTEAIALGHDLGHTPFGHQGERTLNEKARKHGASGFKHNFQSLKVATVLEEEYIEYAGWISAFKF